MLQSLGPYMSFSLTFDISKQVDGITLSVLHASFVTLNFKPALIIFSEVFI